uniref:Uncharacterized protein n=1 Tax=Magallana gigas TaxID=29159 RepID=K1QF77_MAGGI
MNMEARYRGLTKVNEQYWASVQGKVKDWIQKTDATVLVLYIPQPTKRNPIPTLKFEGSRKLKAVVESEEVRSAISTACSGPPPPVKSFKDEMVNITIQPWTMQVKRCIISCAISTACSGPPPPVKSFKDVELKYGKKRDIWGYPSLKPEWWPNGTDFISPNERRTNSEGSGRKDFEEGSGEVLKEVSGSEDVMTGALNETPDMNSSLHISPALSAGEGFVSDGPESMEGTEMERTSLLNENDMHRTEEVSGSEDVMTGASNETPGMISPLPISPTQSVGEGFVSDGPESTEMEMDVEEMDLPDAKDETAIPDENGNIQKIWSKQRNDSVEPFLLSKTCGVNINNRSLISAKSLITDEFAEAVVLKTSLHLPKDNVLEMRCNIMKTIINNQDEDTNNLCRRCYRHEPPNSKVKSIKWVQCDGCAISWYHAVCLKLKQVFASSLTRRAFKFSIGEPDDGKWMAMIVSPDGIGSILDFGDSTYGIEDLKFYTSET